MTGTERPFSIYVPGLSGIPQVEERRTESIIRRGVASGDANLYLRNVLLLINESEKLDELVDAIRVVFPSFNLFIEFDQERDLYISVSVSITGPHGKRIPIELVGTGVQQALQIFSYIVLFRPYVLLLDEPDSHLHPDNQGLLAKSLLAIASETDTKVLISTHSRHLVDALYDDANVIWMKDGRIFQQGDNVVRVPLLMDLGALDSFEKIREGEADWVFLSEDASLDLARQILRASGYEDDKLVVYSYKTSSNLQSALALAEFVTEIAPKTRVIIHRDRDFMTEQEIVWLSEQIEESGAIPFVTEGVDVESYFTRPLHIACLLETDVAEVERWLDEIAVDCHNELCHKFTRKRDDARALYRRRPESPPDTMDQIGPDSPLPRSKRLGKFMLRKVRGGLHARFGVAPDVTAYSEHIASERLAAIRNDVDG